MTTKRTLATSLALLALAVGGCGGDDEESSAGSGTTESQGAGGGSAEAKSKVDIKDFKFTPKAVKVETDKPGTYAYYCIYHRFMTGTVEVSG